MITNPPQGIGAVSLISVEIFPIFFVTSIPGVMYDSGQVSFEHLLLSLLPIGNCILDANSSGSGHPSSQEASGVACEPELDPFLQPQ
jgi:hypothetical protein